MVDHFVFERILPPKGPWKLKERVEPTMPAFTVAETDKGQKEDGKQRRNLGSR